MWEWTWGKASCKWESLTETHFSNHRVEQIALIKAREFSLDPLCQYQITANHSGEDLDPGGNLEMPENFPRCTFSEALNTAATERFQNNLLLQHGKACPLSFTPHLHACFIDHSTVFYNLVCLYPPPHSASCDGRGWAYIHLCIPVHQAHDLCFHECLRKEGRERRFGGWTIFSPGRKPEQGNSFLTVVKVSELTFPNVVML